jgi:hypothetical protein
MITFQRIVYIFGFVAVFGCTWIIVKRLDRIIRALEIIQDLIMKKNAERR